MSGPIAITLQLVFAGFLIISINAQSIGLNSSYGQAADFFSYKYPYNQSWVSYPFANELDNPYVCKLGSNIMGANVYNAMLTLAPCTYITEHYHPESHEYNHILKGGGLEYSIVLGNGTVFNGTSPLGSTLMLPHGLTHIILNNNCVPTTMHHFFQVANPIFLFSVPAIVNMPNAFKAATFGVNIAAQLNQELLKTRIPDGIHSLDAACLARCRFTPKGLLDKYAKGMCASLNAQGF